MALHLDDLDEFGAEAPRPLSDDTIARGSFEQLSEGQGAVMARSGYTDHAKAHTSKRKMAAAAVAILAAIALITTAFVNALSAPVLEAEETDAQPQQTVVAADETLAYRNANYALVEGVEGYTLAELHDGEDNGQFVSLGDVPGTPIALVLYDGALVIPQNLGDGSWDVLAYTIGVGWSQIMDADGNAQTGEGIVTDARLDGSTLVLSVNGADVPVPLAW